MHYSINCQFRNYKFFISLSYKSLLSNWLNALNRVIISQIVIFYFFISWSIISLDHLPLFDRYPHRNNFSFSSIIAILKPFYSMGCVVRWKGSIKVRRCWLQFNVSCAHYRYSFLSKLWIISVIIAMSWTYL